MQGAQGICWCAFRARRSPRVDAQRDVVPIVCVSKVVLAISVSASLNVNTLDQLVALARERPGTLNAAAGSGISDFLLFGFIKNMGL